jgi:hypothetical protein
MIPMKARPICQVLSEEFAQLLAKRYNGSVVYEQVGPYMMYRVYVTW